MIRVALADDHEIVRSGIQTVIESDPEIKVVWRASDGQETLDKLSEDSPDVLVLDIRMPILNGLEVVKAIKSKKLSDVKIIMLSMHSDRQYILNSMEYGSDGYLLKDTSKLELHKAIKTVHSGQKYFSGDISNTIITSLLDQSTDKPSPESGIERDYNLTKRENEILDMIYAGDSNKTIAEKLNKSIRTIETHRFNIMKKMEVGNIAELLKKVEKRRKN
ncbi:MAG: response regulator transcription factor [Bacteroidota bacterium]